MTTKDKTKAADRRRHQAEPVYTGNTNSGTPVVDGVINASIDAVAAITAPAPEPNAIGVGENRTTDNLTAASADSSVASITGLDPKPTGEISTPRPERDDSKGQHVVLSWSLGLAFMPRSENRSVGIGP